MSTQTYEHYKAVVDAANPTPPLGWRLYKDDTSHIHDDHVVARSKVLFLGLNFRYEVHMREGWWFIHPVDDPDEPRPHSTQNGETWEICKANIASAWEAICESRAGANGTGALRSGRAG